MSGKCTELWFNWRQVSDENLAGEDFDFHRVGERCVESIERKQTQMHNFYIVKFEDGSMEEIYNPNRAFFKE